MDITIYDDMNDIKCDTCVYYQRYKKSNLGVSNIIKWCAHDYAIIIDLKHLDIVGIIDISNKIIIRFKSDNRLTEIAKFANIKVSPKIYHIK